MSDIRILVVEDQLVLQYVAKRQLAVFGLEAEFVQDGQDAVDAVLRSKYDIVFMDVMLLEMDGLKATRLIRASEETTRTRTPIIGMTAYAMADKCRDAGMDDFVQKPVMLEQLQAMLVKWTAKMDQACLSAEEVRRREEQLLSVQEKLVELRTDPHLDFDSSAPSE